MADRIGADAKVDLDSSMYETPERRDSYSSNQPRRSTSQPQPKRRRVDGPAAPQSEREFEAFHPEQMRGRMPLPWAAVNLPEPAPPPIPQTTGNRAESNSSVPCSAFDSERPEETVVNDNTSVPLIDTLPKVKQRQIFSLVSGLQGGIEHLQKELDTLKKALGIDDAD